MRVLAVDPGLLCTGYGVVESNPANPQAGKKIVLLEAGIIKTSPREKLAGRLKKIHNGLNQIAGEYQPDVLVLEELYSHYQHPRTAILMAHARGISYLVAANQGIEVVGYSAKKIKKAIVGSGAAKKLQMQKVIREMLKLTQMPAPADVADALALALAHIHIASVPI